MVAVDRRRFVKRAAALTGTASVALSGCLDDTDTEGEFPNDDFNVIIPFGQGGGTDMTTRAVWDTITDLLGVSPQYENVPGAAGMQGTSQIYQAQDNGYTVGPLNSPFVTQILLQEPGFTLDEFRHIGIYASEAWVFVTNPELDIDGFDELVESYQDGELETIGAQQPGAPNHILAEVLKNNPEFDMAWNNHIAYDGSGPIIEAVASGEVPAGIVTETAAEGASDMVDTLVSLSSEGSSVFGDLPAYTDYGFPQEIDFMGEFNRSFIAPPETSDDRVNVLNNALQEALEDEELQEIGENAGMELEYLGGEDAVLEQIRESRDTIPNVVDLDEL